jgi:Protein of unknown function (DUF5818)
MHGEGENLHARAADEQLSRCKRRRWNAAERARELRLHGQEEDMKSKLVLCSMVLGCSMGLMAQQSSSAPGATPGTTTPPTFPQDQSQQTTTDKTQSSSQTGQTNTNEAGQMGGHSGNAQKVEGCLSGTDGNFSLTDKSGMTYQLQGSNSDLAKHVGQEVRIEGTSSAAGSGASSSSASSSSESASPSSSSTASGNTLTVNKVKKVSDTCSTSSGSSAAPKQ